jgi:hypothetical protein
MPGAEVLRSTQVASADVRPGVSCLSTIWAYRACVGKARMGRPENKDSRKESNETRQQAEEAAGKGSTGRDSGFGLARPVQLQNEETK